MSNFSIALKIKAKHGLLFNYMNENNLTYDKMSELTGISKATLNSMIHFRWSPKKNNDYRTLAVIQKLERFFDCPIEEIFPPALIDKIANNKEIRELLQGTRIVQKEVDLEYLSFDELPEISYEPEPEFNFKIDLEREVRKVLNTLTRREQSVLIHRFGLFGEKEHNLEETGLELDITRERVRQIEAKAIRKLRHPKRSNLKSLTDEYVDFYSCYICEKHHLLLSEIKVLKQLFPKETSWFNFYSGPLYLGRDERIICNICASSYPKDFFWNYDEIVKDGRSLGAFFGDEYWRLSRLAQGRKID